MTPGALQEYLHTHIPLSRAMGVEVEVASTERVRLTAPLAPNINHFGTVFGGSASAVAILSAWALLQLGLLAEGIQARLVIQRNSMSYDVPMPGDFSAEAEAPAPERWQRFLATLTKHQRARIEVRALVSCGGRPVGGLQGDFVAILGPEQG